MGLNIVIKKKLKLYPPNCLNNEEQTRGTESQDQTDTVKTDLGVCFTIM